MYEQGGCYASRVRKKRVYVNLNTVVGYKQIKKGRNKQHATMYEQGGCHGCAKREWL